LVKGINWLIARFVDTLVKSIGTVVFALLLSWISEISTDKDGRGLVSRSSTRNLVINARIVVSKSESSSIPCPLQSP
jgi:hypothetical protein